MAIECCEKEDAVCKNAICVMLLMSQDASNKIAKSTAHGKTWTHMPLCARFAADVRSDCLGMTVEDEAEAVLGSLAKDLRDRGGGS